MRCKGKFCRYSGAGCLNFFKNGTDGFAARFPISSAKAGNKDGIFIGEVF